MQVSPWRDPYVLAVRQEEEKRPLHYWLPKTTRKGFLPGCLRSLVLTLIRITPSWHLPSSPHKRPLLLPPRARTQAAQGCFQWFLDIFCQVIWPGQEAVYNLWWQNTDVPYSFVLFYLLGRQLLEDIKATVPTWRRGAHSMWWMNCSLSSCIFCFSLHPWSSLLFPGPLKAPPLISLLLNLKRACVCVLSRFSCIHLFVTPWTVSRRASLFVVFPRQKYWSELPFPSPGDLPDPGIELTSLKSPVLACRFFTTDTTWEAFIASVRATFPTVEVENFLGKKSHTNGWVRVLGTGPPLQYSCLGNPRDGGAWWAAVHGVAEGRTRLSDFTFTFHSHALEKKMATHSSVVAWRISGTGEPGGLPSMGSHRVGYDWIDLAAAAACYCIINSNTRKGRKKKPSFLLSV